jgi:hypothetical protein
MVLCTGLTLVYCRKDITASYCLVELISKAFNILMLNLKGFLQKALCLTKKLFQSMDLFVMCKWIHQAMVDVTSSGETDQRCCSPEKNLVYQSTTNCKY